MIKDNTDRRSLSCDRPELAPRSLLGRRTTISGSAILIHFVGSFAKVHRKEDAELWWIVSLLESVTRTEHAPLG